MDEFVVDSHSEFLPSTSTSTNNNNGTSDSTAGVNAGAFGQRYLRDESAVFTHNAWDDVDWPEEETRRAVAVVEAQKAAATARLDDGAAPVEKWDDFYAAHTNRFFMDRKWVSREFPEIFQRLNEGKMITILDVGCGVGNTTFPLLNAIDDGECADRVFLHSCDFSATAIQTLRANAGYDPSRCNAFVWDVVSTRLPSDADDAMSDNIGAAKGSTHNSDRSAASSSTPSLRVGRPSAGSVDFILCIYVLSALRPETHACAMRNLSALLAPGGIVFIKDYARYDLTQLRFKPQRLIAEHFYARGDGTLVYFFDADELHALLANVGLTRLQNYVDKRLIVNRAKQLKMYRRWIQCKYAKPL